MFSNQSGRWGIFIMVILILGPMGCAKTDANRTRAEGAGAGAIVGGVLGQIVGGDTGATLAGAAVGALIGTLIGDQVAQEKTTAVEEEKRLVELAGWAKERAGETAKFNNQLQQEIVLLQKTNNRLNSKLLAASERKRLMIAKSTSADKLRHQTNEQMNQVTHDLALLQGEIEKARSSSQGGYTQSQEPQSASLQLVVNQTTYLDNQREALVHSIEQLQLIDTRRD